MNTEFNVAEFAKELTEALYPDLFERETEQEPVNYNPELETQTLALKKFREHISEDPLDHIWGTEFEQQFTDAIMQKDRTKIADIILKSWDKFPEFLADAEKSK